MTLNELLELLLEEKDLNGGDTMVFMDDREAAKATNFRFDEPRRIFGDDWCDIGPYGVRDTHTILYIHS
jgi:hypothetical protein